MDEAACKVRYLNVECLRFVLESAWNENHEMYGMQPLITVLSLYLPHISR